MGITTAATRRNDSRTVRRFFVTTVTDRQEVSANTRRFTLSAPELADFAPLGPDEYFALVIPTAQGLPEVTLGPDDDIRQALLDLDDAVRPTVRWYTVRKHRPEYAEVDVDIVVHGETGPASTWAVHAQVGDRVGFREAGAPYLAPPTGRQLIVGDETSLPAIAAILESAAGALDAEVLVELPHAEDAQAVDTLTPISWLLRGDERPGTRAVEEVRTRLGAGERFAYAWACGEAQLATSVRRLLVTDHGMDPDAVMFSGYWRLGQARG